MIFTSFDYVIFLGVIFAAYWLVRDKRIQNVLLLAGSYIFYGYVHPWFCILIAVSTVVDYFCGMGMVKSPERKKVFLGLSLLCNLGMLGFFKYFNFFADNVVALMNQVGLGANALELRIFLPVGISFYTFQTLSYTIDIYRGELEPRKNFIDFAVFVSFFPQLVAGPIERAKRFLPQVEQKRVWNWDVFASAWPLIIRGYLKKLVIADNVAIYVDKVFMLESPTFFLLAAGAFAFAVQIYADFSAYTDIARGSARLLGFELIENFKSPYLAISPSDFWRRWHISFSTWIRDYLYIPLGGSRVKTKWGYAFVLLATLGLSGLWHGAAWNFVIWGIYHAVLVFVYHQLGIAGRWRPRSAGKLVLAWGAMSIFTLIGWMIFRASDFGWLMRALTSGFSLGLSGDSLVVGLTIIYFVLFYSLPLFVMLFIDRVLKGNRWVYAVFYGFAMVAIILLFREGHMDFIYFQF